MTSTVPETDLTKQPFAGDGFAVLDAGHVQAVLCLGKLAALVSRLSDHGADPDARTLAREVVDFFSATSRQHHEDEERHVFPRLLESGDAEVVQNVLRLQQDHAWLEEDWLELAPQLDAVACGQGWFDIDILREGVEIFTTLSIEHMALEESLIYPAARNAMATSERRSMAREMAIRRRAHRPGRTSRAG